jgi:hypothetical protein
VSPPKLLKIVNISPNDKITLNKIKIYILKILKKKKTKNKQTNKKTQEVAKFIIIFLKKKSFL